MWKKLLILLLVFGLAFAAMMLTTGQSRFQVSDTLFIESPPDRVWEVVTEIEDWPLWWPGVEKARVTPDLQAGARFTMDLKGNPQKRPAIIEAVIPQRRLSWQREGILKSTAATTLSLQPEPGGSRMTLKTSIRGPQAFLARFTGEQQFAHYHQRVLDSLRSFLLQEGAAGHQDAKTHEL